MDYKKLFKWIIVAIGLSVLIYIYKSYNPANSYYFPKCVFRSATGYKCPGCGSQRAIHYLLNFDVYNAFKQNMILVLSVPYLFLAAIFDIITSPSPKILRVRNILFGVKSIYFILAIIIVYWLLRNIPYCNTHCYIY